MNGRVDFMWNRFGGVYYTSFTSSTSSINFVRGLIFITWGAGTNDNVLLSAVGGTFVPLIHTLSSNITITYNGVTISFKSTLSGAKRVYLIGVYSD